MATELRDQPTRPPPGSEGGCSEAGRPAVAPPLVPKAARFALRPHEAVMAATRRQVRAQVYTMKTGRARPGICAHWWARGGRGG